MPYKKKVEDSHCTEQLEYRQLNGHRVQQNHVKIIMGFEKDGET